MNAKVKLAIIISIPIILIWLWVGIFFSLTKDDVKADILWTGTTNNNTTIDLSKDNPAIPSGAIDNSTGASVISDTKPKQLTNINLYMPVYLYNYNGWKTIINRLAQKDIILKIITNTSDQDYYDYLSGKLASTGNQVDIFLIDNTHIKDFEKNISNFSFSQDISALFHYVFYDYISHNQNFVPFGVDPMVTFSRNIITSNPNKIERDDIINNSIIGTDGTGSKDIIPILFGLSKYDMTLLNDKKEVYDGFTDILSNVIYQSKFRWEILDIIKWYSATSLEIKLRDFVKFKKNLSLLDEGCAGMIKLCFMKAWLTNFAFGYMSEYENYKLLGGSDYRMYNFPVNTNLYPVKLWWFSINKANYDRIIRSGVASEFFQEYLDQAAQGNAYLRPSIYSSFNNVIETQKNDLQLIYLSYFITKRGINPIIYKDSQTYNDMVAVADGKKNIEEFVSTAELLK